MAQLRGKSSDLSDRTGATRAGRTASSGGPADEDPGPARAGLEAGGPVRWGAVATVVRALAATVVPVPSSWRTLERLAIGLTEPLRRLDQLARDTDRAVHGDDHSAARVRATFREVALLSRRVDLGQLLAGAGSDAGVGPAIDAAPGGGADAGPGAGHEPPATAPGSLFSASATTREPATAHGATASAILDEAELTTMLLGVAQVVDPDDRTPAADAVTVLVLATAALGSLAVAHDDAGVAGLVARLESLAGTGALGWAGTRIGAPAAAGPLPAAEDASTIGPPAPEPTPSEGASLDTLLAQLRTRPRWDPDLLDHAYPWWEPLVEAVDPRWWDGVSGFLAVRRRLTARTEPAPVRPERVVWSDGIAGVELADTCAGSTITITGTGFGVTQPPDVALLLPTLRGCRPVPPLSWSDTRITAALPVDVASGPVGFADAGCVSAYDAWAARRNAADVALESVPCVRSVPVLTEPFLERPPATPITTVRAGVPLISAFAANGATLLALEAGMPLRLHWTVRNAETVTVERTSTSGPLLAGGTTLVDPVATSIVLGVPSYSTLQVWTYRLTVTGASGVPVSRTVTVVAGKRPALRIETIEVTQSIQTVPETVRLVESKPTVVRVTVRHGLEGFGSDLVPNVRGRIRVHGPELGVSPWVDAANGSGPPMAPLPGSSITVRAAPARSATNDTLNFLVPPGWARGAATWFDVEVRVDGFGAAGGFAGYSERVARSAGPFAFESRRPLQLRYIRVAWGDGEAPSAAVCASTLAGVVPLLPTPTAGVAALAGVSIQTVAIAAGSNGKAERRALLDAWADRRTCTAYEPLVDWLGDTTPEEDGAIWVLIPGEFVRGEAYDVPGGVCLTPPDDSPYAAHELAHCLAQRHVSLACVDGRTATGGDCPSAGPADARLEDVPFDVVRNTAVSLAGTGVYDVMTSCDTPTPTWPMPARWHRLWDEIGS